MRFIARLIGGFENVTLCITGAGIVILIFAGVIFRYFFHVSLAWVDEVSRFLFIWGSFVGAAAAFRFGEHGGIPLIRGRLSKGGRRRLDGIIAVSIVLFLVTVGYQFIGITMRSFSSGQVSTSTGIPVWAINLGVTIGVALAIFRVIQYYVEHFGAKEVEIVATEKKVSGAAGGGIDDVVS